MRKIQRALISVSDKSGLEDLLAALSARNVEILSTGGTLKKIQELGYKAISVDSVTGFPEMMNGRVKTLHPKIHGALLGLRDNSEHIAAMKAHDIVPIDLVVINLYPFEEVVAREGTTLEEAIENIDIGGPSMIRSASKNYRDVCVLVNPSQYPSFLKNYTENDGAVNADFRFECALAAFRRTAEYDQAISTYLESQSGAESEEKLSLSLTKVQPLRYGENPHQKAAFYAEKTQNIFWKKLHGKELSYNNLLDLDAALDLMAVMDRPFCALLKHTNPCGMGAGGNQLENLRKAMQADPVSFFGGIGVFSETVEAASAEELSKHFMEIIVAPDFSPEALKIFQAKKNLRLLQVDITRLKAANPFVLRSAAGGILRQEADRQFATADSLEVKTEAKPDAKDIEELLFADRLAQSVKSNAIVFTRDGQSLGIGAGQMSRVDSMRFAIEKAALAGLSLKGSYLGSDAFFPFRDAIDLAAETGVKGIIQPGGSIRDEETIAAANESGIIMVFTGIRHFRH